MQLTEAKFKKEDVVYERVYPTRKLVVQHFTDGLYYCRLPENYKRSFVYQERELKASVEEMDTPAFVL
jgi:hypothetical protein